MLDANASEELVGVWYLRQEREMRAIQRGREEGGGLGAGISDNKELHSWRAE